MAEEVKTQFQVDFITAAHTPVHTPTTIITRNRPSPSIQPRQTPPNHKNLGALGGYLRFVADADQAEGCLGNSGLGYLILH